jgi:ABC-type branched-subunit amino acid transport system substrate-binding protein
MAAGAAAAAAAVAQAIKASGVLVRMEPDEFLKILRRVENPLVVVAKGWFFNRGYQYLTSYKGLAFLTKSPDPLMLPANVEIVQAGRIWTPG